MRGVSKRSRYVITAGILVAVLTAPGAFAADDESGRFLERIQRAKRFIVTVLSRIGGPPG
jgi:hypothetical protein